VIKLDVEANFYTVPRILTGDLSALDNFLIYRSLNVILAFVQIGLTHAVNVRQSLKLICGNWCWFCRK